MTCYSEFILQSRQLFWLYCPWVIKNNYCLFNNKIRQIVTKESVDESTEGHTHIFAFNIDIIYIVFIFFILARFKQHLPQEKSIARGKENEEFKCDLCGKKFVMEYILKRHMISTHRNKDATCIDSDSYMSMKWRLFT